MFEFPKTPEEAKGWKPCFERHAIHSQVLLVAKTRIEGTWKAYCVPVPGVNHEEEQKMWQEYGTPMTEKMARAAFPRFEEVPYAK